MSAACAQEVSAPTEQNVHSFSPTRRGYYIYVTEACNLRCNYCFVSDKENNHHLTPAMADKVLAFIGKDASGLKETYIHFFGGEPLVRPSMVDYLAGRLIAWGKEQGVKVKLGITTNGTLLTKPVCEMLKGHEVGVQLSLDGSREGNDVHRQLMGGSQFGMRPSGAFGLVQIQNYFDYFGKASPNCRMTLTVHNLEFLAQSIRDLHGMGFKSFSVIPNSDCGTWAEADYQRYECEMNRVFEYWAANRGIDVNTISQTMGKLSQKKAQSQMCQVGKSILGITVDGDIYPCHDFAGKYACDPTERARLLIGNVESGLIDGLTPFPDLATEKAVSGNGYDCSTCCAKWVCARGCPYMNYARSGDVLRVNAVYCATTRINTTLALRWMGILDDFYFQGANEIQAMRQKLARAVLNAAGGEEDAPFGRNPQGKALLPSPVRLRELGFDLWEGQASRMAAAKPPAAAAREHHA
jgi:uncharacterized protein